MYNIHIMLGKKNNHPHLELNDTQALLLLACVVLLTLTFSITRLLVPSRQPTEPAVTRTGQVGVRSSSAPMTKASVIKRLNTVGSAPLNEKEKENILNYVSSGNVIFTDEERAIINQAFIK